VLLGRINKFNRECSLAETQGYIPWRRERRNRRSVAEEENDVVDDADA
jgi:hypothetical protein